MNHSVQLRCDTALPPAFRVRDMLAFHGRDGHAIAERVGEDALEKGMIWGSRPARLGIRFGKQGATATLQLDGPAHADSQRDFERMVRRMLGLTQTVGAFEARYRDHPHLGALIARNPGLRVPVCATPFEALAWAITGQQISVHAAISLRRKLIIAVNGRHSSGMLCFPSADRVLALSGDALREIGFSSVKARTLLAVSAAVHEGQLPLDAWADTMPVETMRQQLLAMRGIGPWTVHYTLLRGYGWLDGSLHGDVAVQRALGMLLHAQAKPGARETETWLAPFAPWRALVGAHLWATLSLDA